MSPERGIENGYCVPDVMGEGELPDYGKDLNAMHEAESKLTDDEHCSFREHLKSATYISSSIPIIRNERANISPSASQRREALLRTIGKWD